MQEFLGKLPKLTRQGIYAEIRAFMKSSFTKMEILLDYIIRITISFNKTTKQLPIH